MIHYAYTTVVNMNFATAFELFPVDSDAAFTSRAFVDLEDCANSAYYLSEDIAKFLDGDITLDTVSKDAAPGAGADDGTWTGDELFRILFFYEGGIVGQTRVFEVPGDVTIH